MRKQALLLAFIAFTAFAFTSCKKDDKDAKDEVKTEESKQEESKELADNHLYQCPMDCEKGKSYTEEGNCPVCKMALKEKKVDMDGNEDQEEDQD